MAHCDDAWLARYDGKMLAWLSRLVDAGPAGTWREPGHRKRKSILAEARQKSQNGVAGIPFDRNAWWADPANRDRHSDACTRAMESPEVRERMSVARKEWWANPENRKRVTANRNRARYYLGPRMVSEVEVIA